jgi:hypothetical protein
MDIFHHFQLPYLFLDVCMHIVNLLHMQNSGLLHLKTEKCGSQLLVILAGLPITEFCCTGTGIWGIVLRNQ